MDRRRFVALTAAGVLFAGTKGALASSEHPAPVPARSEADRFRAQTDEYSIVPTQYLPQTVSYDSEEAPGTVIIDTDQRYLYVVLGPGRAKRYGVAVGRSGFAWAGSATIGRKTKWPMWFPPPEMRARDREAPAVALRHAGGTSQSPRGAGALSVQGQSRHAVPHPRHARAEIDRQSGILGLHSHAQCRCLRALRAAAARHQGRCAGEPRHTRASAAPDRKAGARRFLPPSHDARNLPPLSNGARNGDGNGDGNAGGGNVGGNSSSTSSTSDEWNGSGSSFDWPLLKRSPVLLCLYTN